jgi:hypothetical protein
MPLLELEPSPELLGSFEPVVPLIEEAFDKFPRELLVDIGISRRLLVCCGIGIEISSKPFWNWAFTWSALTPSGKATSR